MAKTRSPLIGCAFDPEQRSTQENLTAFADELRFYRPRGFSKIARELDRYSRKSDDECGIGFELEDEAMDLLTEWARKRLRHDYVCFNRDGGFAGFVYCVESFLEDCDLKVSDTGEVPRGFSGLVAQISDHGNVEAYRYSRGRPVLLFSAV